MRVTCATRLRWATYECSVLHLVSVYDLDAPPRCALRTTKYLEEADAVRRRVARGKIYPTEWNYLRACSAVLPCE